jgi:phosphoribosylformylglycinamidine synthase
VTDCLNFGSPEDPAVMWQFAEAVRGLADGCLELGIPVTGGNVSFYNQTGTVPINPTPVVGVLGVVDNVADRIPMGFANPGDTIVLLGETREELSGSEWANVVHNHLGGLPPAVDLDAERRLAVVMTNATVTSAHDLAEGGLAQVLVESSLRKGHGAQITLPAGTNPFVQLFSESAGRILVSVARGAEDDLVALAAEHGITATPLGTVGGSALNIAGLFDISLDELREAYTSTLPALFGSGEPEEPDYIPAPRFQPTVEPEPAAEPEAEIEVVEVVDVVEVTEPEEPTDRQ